MEEEAIENNPGASPVHIAADTEDVRVQNLHTLAKDFTRIGFLLRHDQHTFVQEVSQNCETHVHHKTQHEREQSREPRNISKL